MEAFKNALVLLLFLFCFVCLAFPNAIGMFLVFSLFVLFGGAMGLVCPISFPIVEVRELG